MLPKRDLFSRLNASSTSLFLLNCDVAYATRELLTPTTEKVTLLDVLLCVCPRDPVHQILVLEVRFL